MSRLILTIVITILLISTIGLAQVKKLDSLQSLLSRHTYEDTTRVDLLIEISDIIKSTNPDTAIVLALQAYDISIGLNYKKGAAWSKNRLSGAYWMKAFYPEALQLSMEALGMFEEINDVKGIGQSYNSIANTYNMDGENSKSLEYYDKSIKIYQQLDDSYNIKRAHANIGRTYYMLDEYDSAIKYLDIVLKTYDNTEYDIMYSIVKNTKADVLQKIDQLDEALSNYFEALEISEDLQVPRIITYSTRGISEIYQLRGKLDQSNRYAERTFDISKKVGYLENTKNSALILSDNYNSSGNYVESLNYFKAYTASKDSMFNLEKNKELSRLEENFVISQKQKEIELLQTQQNLQSQTNKNQRLILYLLILVVVFIVIVLTIYIRNNRKKQEANKKLAEQRDLLELQNNEILQSQKELLSRSESLKEANNMKDKMFSIISHDLRSPFNSLLMLIENFEFLDLSKNEFEEVKVDIYAFTKSASIMLNNLLTWSKMKIQGLEVEKDIFDIGESSLSILTPFEIVAKQKNIKLESIIEGKLMAYADKGMLEVVLRNIINNSIKFTNEEGVIHVSVKSKNDKFVEVSIVDNGVGMTEEKVDDVISKNLVSATVGTAKEKGTGLGLLIVKDLIASNGGEYFIESEKGRGTSFFFTIPKAIG
jgi:signal transduction histidine kinase